MGRPINKKFFATTSASFGVGIASVAVTSAGENYVNSDTFLEVSAPDMAGGTAAKLSAVIEDGEFVAVNVDYAGDGYVNTPTITIVGGEGGEGAELTATLLPVTTPGLKCTAYLPTGSSAVTSTVVAQKGSRRYKVSNGQGVGVCTLTANASPVAGEMTITATKPGNTTFKVAKLTETVVYDAAGNRYRWSFAAPSTTADGIVIVQLQNG